MSFFLLRLFLLVLFVLSGSLPGAETKAERTANQYAAQEIASAPLHGNLPDYQLPPDKLLQARQLTQIEVTTHFINVVWSIVQLALLLWFGIIAWMRDRAIAWARNRWLQGYSFLLLFLGATTLLDLPLALYSHHLALGYKLSVQGWGSWFADRGKSFLLTWVIGGLLVMLLFLIVRRFPQRWWLVFSFALIPLIFFSEFISPYWIEPLFNQYEPLVRSHPDLVRQLEQVAKRGHMNIPPERMFLMKASRKSTTLNAYVSGFGASKRVVVWDTSLQKGTADEVLFIFGHESGHYVLGHILLGLLLSIPATFFTLYLGFWIVRFLLHRFGAHWRIPAQTDWGMLPVLLFVVTVLSALGEPIGNSIVRYHEHAADVYGQEAIHGIVADPQRTAKQAFDLLGETSLDDPNPGRFVEFWLEDHPTIGRRAAFAKAYDPWQSSLRPKYFPSAKQ